ncbi:MAG: outer membrane protein assembly factor BamA [Candidatus Latescibacter sp.]|nr:outer membrane protein assembly factor BamA [Candidatus Latescibacter sp.]
MKSICLATAGLFMLLLVCPQNSVFAQTNTRILEITVEGNIQAKTPLIINQSGLLVGSLLSVDNTSEAIKRLWSLDIFEDIRIATEQQDNGVKVIIHVKELPAVNTFKLDGFKEFKEQDIIPAIDIAKNRAIGNRKVAKMNKQILDMYYKKGFRAATVDIKLTPVPQDSIPKVDVLISMHEGRKVKVKSIIFEGNKNFTTGKLKKLMDTKEDHWYSSGEYKQETVEKDKEKIVAFYKSKGYRDAGILADSLEVDYKNDTAKIILTVNEGQQYKFGKTTFQGNSVFSERELRPFILYNTGDTFNEMLVGRAWQEITVHYNDAGYLRAGVDPIQVAHNDSVDIQFDIAEDTIAKISKVIIAGNTKTVDKVIRREIQLLPGDAFNRTKFEESARNINLLNFFGGTEKGKEGVEPTYAFDENGKDVNLIYKVSEKQTGVASLGAGFSERDKLVGTLSFSNANLFGRGQSFNCSWDMGAIRKGFQLGFSEPWLFDTKTSFSAEIYDIQRSDYTSAFSQEHQQGGYIRMGRKLKWPSDSRLYLSYRLENINYTNPSLIYRQYLLTGKTSALSLMLIRDIRDDPTFATDGSRTAATVEVAGGPFGGDLSYSKYLLNNEFYAPLFWNLSFCNRSRIGFLKGYKQDRYVPYSERFLPGGTSFDGFVRGYPNREVGPMLSGAEIGGETMLVNNFELQIPIVSKMVYGLIFYDFGNAWRSLGETNPFDVKRSAGVGVRVSIPGIGLIGFDAGYGFDRLEGADKASGWRTHFQFGNIF